MEPLGENQEGKDVGWDLSISMSIHILTSPPSESNGASYLGHPIASHGHAQCSQIENHEDALGAKYVGTLVGDAVESIVNVNMGCRLIQLRFTRLLLSNLHYLLDKPKAQCPP